MVLTIKHKMIIYRRYRCDIWGYCFTNMECKIIYNNIGKRTWFGKKLWPLRITKSNLYVHIKNKILRFFYLRWISWRRSKRFKRKRYVYRFVAPRPYYKQLKFNKRFHSIRLTRLYFLTFNEKRFRMMLRKAAKKDGNFETNYLQYLEGRIYALIYRLNFTSDLFWLLNFVKHGLNVLTEVIKIRGINVVLKIGEVLKLGKKWQTKFSINIKERIRYRTLLFPPPKFIYHCYTFFYFYLMRFPQRKDLVYPISIDLQRVTGYY